MPPSNNFVGAASKVFELRFGVVCRCSIEPLAGFIALELSQIDAWIENDSVVALHSRDCDQLRSGKTLILISRIHMKLL
jgi:hypothetical protein